MSHRPTPRRRPAPGRALLVWVMYLPTYYLLGWDVCTVPVRSFSTDVLAVV